MQVRILVVEDRQDISDIVTKYLQKEGYEVIVAKDGFEALEIFNSEKFHLVLLDVMLPGISGFEVLAEIRAVSDLPVLMLTAMQQEADRLKGFDKGADDYILKPFSPRELVSRVKVFLKRVYRENEEQKYQYQDFCLYQEQMKLTKGDKDIPITSAEYRLLSVFFKNKGKVLSREQLISLAFGSGYDGYDRNIDSHIKRIRQKIETDPAEPRILLTKYGAGYLFGGDEDEH